MKKRFKKLGKALFALAYIAYYFLSPAVALNVFAASGDISNSPVVATNGKGENEQGYIKVTKTITADPENPGEYFVNFNIKGNKYEETHQVPSYTIFVLDTSDSMDDTVWGTGTTRFAQAKAAIKAASAKLVENPNGKVALIQFGTDSDPAKIVGFKHAALEDSDFKQSWGGTNYDAGLMNAKALLNTVINAEGVKNIIFISDGKPSVGLVKHDTLTNYSSWWNANNYVYESYFDEYYYATSDGTTYLNNNTVQNLTIWGFEGRESGQSNRNARATFNGINYTRNNTLPELKSLLKGSNDDPHNNIYSFSYMVNTTEEQNTLKKIATNDASGNPRWKNVDASSIVTELQAIADEISQSAAGVGATLTDEVGLDFNVIDNGNFTVVDGDMAANIGEIPDGNGVDISFKIKINPYASTGDHDTNGSFDLKYKVHSSDSDYQHVTTDNSPSVYWVSPESKVTVHYYLDGTETKLAADNESDVDVVTQTDGTRTTYTAPVANIYGYTFDSSKTVVKDGTTTVDASDYTVDDNGAATVLYYIDGTTVNYYYTKNNAEVTDPEVAKTGDDASVNKTINDSFNYQIKYNSTVDNYIGDVTVTITDTLPYEIDESKTNNLNGGTYNKNNKTITWTETVSIDEENPDINITKNISVYYKDINNKTVTNNVNVVVKEGTKTIDDEDASYTNTIGSGTVIVAHQDTAGTTLAPSSTYNGLAGVEYNHQNEDENIYGYTVKSRTPDKSVGSFTDGTITVIYVYEKNSGTITNETLTKTANPTTNTFDGQFGYTISYSATIDNYVGNATLIITDTPQYRINTAATYSFGNNANCTATYDEATNTITWTYNVTGIDADHKSISLNLTYNFYFNPDEISYSEAANTVVNTAASALTVHGETDSTTTKEATATVNLKVSNITEIYKSGNTELDKKGPTPNLVNKSYTMEEKEFYGYTHVSHDKEVTSYGENDITITHTYSKNEPEVGEVTITKSGDTAEKAVDEAFNYTISYETVVDEYVGEVTATMTDTLPFSIDTTKAYELDGGTYNSTNNTITWTVTKDITATAQTNESEKTITISKNISLYYKDITEDELVNGTDVVNNVEVVLTADNKPISEEEAFYTNTIATGTVIVHHIDKNTNEAVAGNTTQTGLAGTDYTTSALNNIYGYEWDQENPEKYLGQFTKSTIDVYYKYVNKNGSVTDDVTKTNPTGITSLLDSFEYHITYNAIIDEYVGNATLIIKDTPQYKIDLSKEYNFAGGVYDEETNTITWTVNVNGLNETNNRIIFDKTINFYYRVDDVTSGITNTVTSKLTYGTETSTDSHTTDEVEVNKSDVYTAYIDADTEEPIAESDLLINDYIGKSYDATGKAKDIHGYTWNGENPNNLTGSIVSDPTIVIFKYTKNPGTLENEEYTKTLENEKTALESLENGFEYKLTYTAEVTDFVGTATLTVTDTPSVKIDTTKNNNFADGVYDEATNTITWTVSMEVEEDTTLEFEKTIKVFYVIDEVNGEISNTANYKVDLDENTPTDDDVTITNEVNKSSITELYLYDTNRRSVTELDKIGPTENYVGKPYTMTIKDIYGYTYLETENGTDKFLGEDTVIKHYYTKNPGTLENEEYTKTLENEKTALESLENGFEYKLTYTAEVTDFVGTATLTVTDTPSVKIDTTKNNNFADGVYDEATNTITWTVSMEVEEDTTLEFEKTIKVFYVIDEVNGEISNTANYKVDLDENTPTDDDVTITNEVNKSSIEEVYVYNDNGKEIEISRKDAVTDYVGKPYTSTKKDFYGYTYVKTENDTTKFLEEDTTIKHIYTKNPGEITDEEPVKTAPEVVDSINSAFEYTLTYSATINDYVGTAKTTFVDELPYEIDESKSDLDGGVYDKSTKTITWEAVETEIDELNRTISITKNIKVYYINIDSSEITNNFNVETNYDAETSTTDTDATTKVKEGTVIVHHVDIDGNKIIEDEVFTGLVGEEYTTSQKDFGEYYLEDFKGEVEGTFKEGTIEVTYIYNLSGQGDIEPPQTGLSAISFFAPYGVSVVFAFILALITKKIKVKA